MKQRSNGEKQIRRGKGNEERKDMSCHAFLYDSMADLRMLQMVSRLRVTSAGSVPGK